MILVMTLDNLWAKGKNEEEAMDALIRRHPQLCELEILNVFELTGVIELEIEHDPLTPGNDPG